MFCIYKAIDNGKTEITVIEYGYTNEQVVNISKQGLEQCLDMMENIFTRP